MWQTKKNSGLQWTGFAASKVIFKWMGKILEFFILLIIHLSSHYEEKKNRFGHKSAQILTYVQQHHSIFRSDVKRFMFIWLQFQPHIISPFVYLRSMKSTLILIACSTCDLSCVTVHPIQLWNARTQFAHLPVPFKRLWCFIWSVTTLWRVNFRNLNWTVVMTYFTCGLNV